jgi:hypothetical protein
VAGEGEGERGGGVVAILGGPGLPGVVGQQRAQEPLAGHPDQQRTLEAVQLVQPLQQLPVVLAGLGEAEARIDDQSFGRDPACSAWAS